MSAEKERLFDMVDKEQIYTHMYTLEGPRFPLDNMDKLDEAAEYIREKMNSYGANVITHEFSVDGFEGIFQNIEAHFGDESQPALIFASHYDSVEFCPGANDNLTGVAICLEISRILSQHSQCPHIIVNFFTLEEGHPGLNKKLRDAILENGIMDDSFRFKKVKYLEQYQILVRMMKSARAHGKPYAVGIEEFIQEFSSSFTDNEANYYKTVLEVYRPYSTEDHFGKLILVGSNRWVENAVKNNLQIKGVINIDTVGTIKHNRFSQSLPPIPRFMLRLNRTHFRKKCADFILVAADKNTKTLYRTFLKEARDESVGMPYVGLRLPFTYSSIVKMLPDLLRADHAPFWRYNIPSIFLTDTAELRWDRYHTKADEVKYLDFEVLKKITKAAIATVLEM